MSKSKKLGKISSFLVLKRATMSHIRNAAQPNTLRLNPLDIVDQSNDLWMWVFFDRQSFSAQALKFLPFEQMLNVF